MLTKGTAPSLGKDGEDLVRQQLERMLASATFRQVDRLKHFLKFIVTEAAAGRGDELKEYVVGVQVFGKEDSFDPRTDPVVRVQARRLRARLDRYYQEEGQTDDIVIELPKGGYTPVFNRRPAAGPRRRSVTAALADRNTAVVLPFADHSASGDLDYFCRGVREEVIHALAALPSLRVLAMDSADAVAGGGSPDPGNRDAAMIIGGSIRRSGNAVRVTAQLIDGASGCYLWSESIDETIEDVFGAQERVARAIVARVEPELGEPGAARRSQRPTSNLAAHNLLLQGRYHLSQRTEEGLLKAVDFFSRALVEDAQFAQAHSGLADAYGLLNHYGVLSPADVWTKVAASAATAVMLDGNSAEAHTSLAHTKSTQDWDWHGAEREFQYAIALDPRYATARHWYATSCLAPMGRLDEALEQILLAESLDPVSSIIARDVAVTHYLRRDFDAALEQCDHAIELNPHFSPAYHTLGLVQEQLGDLDESTAAFQRAAHLSPRSPRMQAALARNYALTGKKQQAMAVLKQLETLARERYVSPAEFGWVSFALRQTDVGFEWLAKACDDRCFELLFVKVDPRFDPLRHERRFAALVASLKLD